MPIYKGGIGKLYLFNHKNVYQYDPHTYTDKIDIFCSNKLCGILHNSQNGPTFIANDFVGYQYRDLNNFVLKNGVSLNIKTIDHLIKDLEVLKETLEAIELAKDLSRE